MRHQLCMRGCRPHASSSGTQTIQFTSAGISSCAVVMPKTKSSKCGQRGTQGPARHSARSLTRALTRSTVSAPTPSKRALSLSPIHWPRGLWSVGPHLRTRAKIQGQQAAAAQDCQGSLVANAVEITTQQSIAGQPTVTTTHSGQPITGIGHTLVLNGSACTLYTQKVGLERLPVGD